MSIYFISDEQAIELKKMQYTIYGACVDAGWHDNKVDIPRSIALCHSELSEALEGDRCNLMDKHLPLRLSIEVELADVVIRVFDLCASLGLDIGKAMQEKFEYNQRRPDHKLENRNKIRGKKY